MFRRSFPRVLLASIAISSLLFSSLAVSASSFVAIVAQATDVTVDLTAQHQATLDGNSAHYDAMVVERDRLSGEGVDVVEFLEPLEEYNDKCVIALGEHLGDSTGFDAAVLVCADKNIELTRVLSEVLLPAFDALLLQRDADAVEVERLRLEEEAQQQNDNQDEEQTQRECRDARNHWDNRNNELRQGVEDRIKRIEKSGISVENLNNIKTRLEGLLSEGDGKLALCTRNSLNDFWQNVNGEVDNLFSDFYFESDDLDLSANNKERLKDLRRDFDRNFKRNCERDKAREVKNLKKEIERAEKDGMALPASVSQGLAGVESSFSQMCVDKLNELKRYLEVAESGANPEAVRDAIEDFDFTQRDFWDFEQDFWNGLNDTREIVNQLAQVSSCREEAGHREKELKNMRSELKRIKGRAKRDFPNIEKLVGDFERLVERAKNFVPSADTNCWEPLEDMNFLQQDIWDMLSRHARVTDQARWLRDAEKEWFTHRVRELSGYRQEVKRDAEGGVTATIIEDLEELLVAGQRLVKEAKDSLSSPAPDPNRVEDILGFEIQDVRSEWDEITHSFFEKRDERFKKFEFEQIREEIEQGLRKIDSLVAKGNIDEAKAALCRGYAEEGLALVHSAMNGEDVFVGIEALSSRADKDCGDVFDTGHRNVGDFRVEFGFEEINKDRFEAIFNRVAEETVNRVMERMAERFNQELLKRLTEVDAELDDHMARLIEAVSTYVPEDKIDSVIREKEEFLALSDRLKSIASRAGCESLGSLRGRIARATLIDDSAAQMRSFVEEFANRAEAENFSGAACADAVSELMPRVDTVLDSGREELHRKKIIPFKDTGLDQYFTGNVAELAALGIVTGMEDASGRKLGTFDPGAEVRISELLKMVWVASGVGKASVPPELCGGKYARDVDTGKPHWAAGYVAQAEAAGLSIVSECVDINRSATRAEVVQIIIEAAQVVPPRAQSVGFPDVSTQHKLADFIEHARVIKLLKGDGDGNARPDSSVVRAEAATFVKRGIKILTADSR
jgi:hypothetical protein